jgi:hypothetical protein
MKILGVFLILFISFSARAQLRTISDIDAYLTRNPAVTLEGVIAQLDPEIRKRFLLVYKTRSPNSATLKNPRIILSNEDSSFIISFTGAPSGKRGNVIEFIEADPNTDILGFRELTFVPGQKSKIDYHPTVYAHFGTGIRIGREF